MSIVNIKILNNVALNPEKTVVIIVDMQNDFVNSKGKLYVPGAEKTVLNIKRLLLKARKKNVPVIYTQDWHEQWDPEFRIWGEHAVAGSWGAEIIDELKPREYDIIVKKLRYDAFYGTPLEYILRGVLRRDSLIIVGTVANICVLHTVGSAALRMFETIVPLNGVSALNDFDMKIALRQMDFLYKTLLVKSVDDIFFT